MVARTLFLVAALAAPVTLLAENEDQIEYRLHIMRTLAAEMTAVDLILKEKAPVESLPAHARILSAAASTARAAFQEKAPSQHAKPEIWDNWTDFEQRIHALLAATQDLAKTAQSDGLAAARVKAQATAQVCKGCHDAYRVPRE